MSENELFEDLTGEQRSDKVLIVKRSDLQTMFDHGNAGYPDEVCGILSGKDGTVEKVYPMKNARPGPATYEMDPEEQFRVMKDIRDAGFEMIGIFHSHPGGHAYPSSVDVEKAYWPGTRLPNYPRAVYVIISLMNRASPVARGYVIDEGRVNEISLAIIESRSDDFR